MSNSTKRKSIFGSLKAQFAVPPPKKERELRKTVRHAEMPSEPSADEVKGLFLPERHLNKVESSRSGKGSLWEAPMTFGVAPQQRPERIPFELSVKTAQSISSLDQETNSESMSSAHHDQPESATPKSPPLSTVTENPESTSKDTDVLAEFAKPGHWSGRGQHVEFQRKETIPLEEGKSLGRGASADVHEVTCGGTILARKQIYCSRRMKLEDVRRELDILKKLNYKHVVILVGSYIQSNVLGLLLFPAAVCDLGVFLDEIEDEHKNDTHDIGDGLSTFLERLEISEKSLDSAYRRLKRIYGCLANAVQYLHDNDIRHKDLKPRNILLDRNDGLFITDFGISRDNTDASTSITAGMERGTYKYSAPEVARFEPRGRAADIYSLGCVFLEIRTVILGESLTEFDEFRTKDDDHSFQNNQDKVTEWIKILRRKQFAGPKIAGKQQIFYILDLIERMVAESAGERPLIGAVTANLVLMERLQNNQDVDRCYFGPCCQVSIHPLNECEGIEYRTKLTDSMNEYDIFRRWTEELKGKLNMTQEDLQAMSQQVKHYETITSELERAKSNLKRQLQDQREIQNRVNQEHDMEIKGIHEAVQFEITRARQELEEALYEARARREVDAQKQTESINQIQSLEAQLQVKKDRKFARESDFNTLFQQLATYREKHG